MWALCSLLCDLSVQHTIELGDKGAVSVEPYQGLLQFARTKDVASADFRSWLRRRGCCPVIGCSAIYYYVEAGFADLVDGPFAAYMVLCSRTSS
jgi:hypothetical protein